MELYELVPVALRLDDLFEKRSAPNSHDSRFLGEHEQQQSWFGLSFTFSENLFDYCQQIVVLNPLLEKFIYVCLDGCFVVVCPHFGNATTFQLKPISGFVLTHIFVSKGSQSR